jgi:signal transduction histidine kinase/ligand-binding sensor domain-containing protein/DNA-binding response OmpR family regulator
MDGLSSNSVRCLYQDRKGFIWIGTDGGGLNRFDGYHFTIFRYHDDNPQSISNNQIFSIIEDHNGYLWVATGNGLNRFDPITGQFKRFYHDPKNAKSLNHDKTKVLYEDSENTLWVGTLMGLHKYEPATETFVNYYEGMTTQDQRPDREINAIIDDHKGNLWLGTWWGGLKKFNKKTGQFTDFYSDSTNPNSIRNNNVMSLYLDNQQVLWIGNYLGGIRKLNIISEKYVPIIDPEKDANIMGICCDKFGRIWYSRTGVGTIEPYSHTFKLLDYDKTKPFGINSGMYVPLMCDKTGIVWLGTEHGLSMYDSNREKFTPYYRTVNSDHYKIEKFYINRDKNILWVGTLKNGLIKYNEYSRQAVHFLPDQTVTNRFFEIQAIYGNNKEQLWIGTNNGIGVLDMKSGKIINTLYNNPIKPTLVNRVYGNNEFMWLNNDNIRICDVLRQKEYEFSTSGALSLPCQQITGILYDHDSNLWIGTFEGLARYNLLTHKIENYYNQLSDTSSISNKYILSLFQDNRKNIWIGTQNGLNRYNVKSNNFVRFTHYPSFASNYILNIKEDSHQNLWLFTDKGITKFNPDNGLTRNYDENDGLEFGGHVFSDKNGLFYCNRRTEDYYVFHPDSIKDNPIIPPVYITRFLLFNKEVAVSTKTHKTPLFTNISETHQMTLMHDQSSMSFEFVALNYTLPEKNQYAYQMEGFDKDWYYTDASHLSATYTNLNPGTYVFRVKASNNDGIWNEKGPEISITILPPFWKTKWAYLIYFIIIASLIYLFRSYLLYQYSLKTRIEIERIKAEKMHEMDQMKLDFFGNISHEFRTPLTLISGPLDYCLERQSELNWSHDHQYLTMMKRNVDRLLHMINKVLDIRKLDSGYLNIYLKNGDIIQFVKSLSGSFSFKAKQKNIQFQTLFHQETFDTWFDPDLIDKIVFNLLSNAFKFTPDHGQISVETVILVGGSVKWKSEKELYDINSSADLVKMIVKDNGIGIPAEQRDKIFDRFYQADNQASRSGGSGIGLALVKELIELVDGQIKLESEEQIGSCFTVWIPIGAEVMERGNNKSVVQKIDPILSLDEDHSLMGSFQSERKLPQTGENTEKPLILIVEDNHDMELFVSNILESNFDILSANNGRTGLELAMENIPDLIVSDIMMPDMDGLEMCQMIRNNERTNHIPIILLTARSTEEYQIEGLFAGADDYIMKPFNAKNLLLRVSNIIKSRQLLREKFSLSDLADPPGQATSLDDVFIHKIRGIVEQHLDNPDFDPQVFAYETGMSRAQLYRKLKAITNQTVNDFIFSVRINRGAWLLLNEGLTVSETAYAVGFKTPAHFSKMFSAHMGQSPSKYVEQHKKALN